MHVPVLRACLSNPCGCILIRAQASFALRCLTKLGGGVLAREILSQLPAGMATELVYLMYKTVIDSTPFFEGLPRDVQTKLCLSMKPYPALAGDLVRSRHAHRHITISAHTSGVARR